MVDILYDVSDGDSATLTVSVQVSTNAGASYDLHAEAFSGVGFGKGRKYAVSFTDDLTSGSWTALESDISGSGEAVSVLDTNTTISVRYYKVQVEME